MDDLPQPILGCAVTAVGVGTILFTNTLKLVLIFGRALGIGFKPKYVKRATPGIEDFAALGFRTRMAPSGSR